MDRVVSRLDGDGPLKDQGASLETEVVMAQIPFSEVHQLNNQLKFSTIQRPLLLSRSDKTCDALPGQARIPLHGTSLDGYIQREHSTPQLDNLAPWLWLVL